MVHAPTAPTPLHPPPTPAGPDRRPPGHRGRRVLVVLAAVLAIVVVGGVLAVVVAIRSYGRAPALPSLTASPDPSLHGTVAFLSHEGPAPCLYAAAASGAATEQLACYERRPAGFPGRVAWLDDGRLLVTAFEEAPSQPVAWRRVYDPSTRTWADVGTGDVVGRPVPAPTAVNADGEQVQAGSDAGHVELVVRGADRSRVVFAADGGEAYTLGDPVWSPDGQWVLVRDSAGRLLLTTVGDPPQTRVLAEQHGEDVAITSRDVLTATTR